MKNYNEIGATWVESFLLSSGYKILSPPYVFAETPWSLVICFFTDKGKVFFKKTPQEFFVEHKILTLINQEITDHVVPAVMSFDTHTASFITAAGGDCSLREVFNGTLDEALLSRGLGLYAEVQRGFEDKTDRLTALALPDWRIQHLPMHFERLLKSEASLAEGLSDQMLQTLSEQQPYLLSLCETLSHTGIKATLVNCDFNENNLIYTRSTQEITLIDWGKALLPIHFSQS